MTDNRGRHKLKKGHKTGKPVKFKGSLKFTAEGEALRKQWEKLTAAERAVWGYNFEAYREAKELW